MEFVKIDSRVSLSGIKACQDGIGHFFPTLPGGVRACQDGLGHFFSTFACLTEGGRAGGGGALKLFGQCPYRTNTFQKCSFLSRPAQIA